MRNIDIKLRPSKVFISLIGLVTLGGMGICFTLPLAIAWKGFLAITNFVYGGWVLWDAGMMKGARSVAGLQLLEKGACKLIYPSETVTAEIRGDSTVTVFVCVLRFNVPGKRVRPSCVIFRDALGSEKYRELLVWLRCC